MRNTILVAETFGPTIQGEGHVAGLPTIFVRTGGCDSLCSWCDSMHAVDLKYRNDWEELSANDVMNRILDLSAGFPLLVSLSGGNPALQPLEPLIDLGQALGYSFALETQGTVAKDWFKKLDYLILSPKPPSSGMQFSRERLLKCLHAAADKPDTALKIVVFNENDFEFAREVSNLFPRLPIYLQAGTAQTHENSFEHNEAARHRYLTASIIQKTLWLVELVKRAHWSGARVGFQQHVILWGDKRGV
jgi:7-carboxy-7-deazaguanine synthase